MKIAIASDHAGIEAKAFVSAELAKAGHLVADLGPADAKSVDYPDYALKVSRAVAAGEAERGILICGTGIGMSMAANKVQGIRAAVCHDEFTSRMSRMHNDANVLCMGARLLANHRMADLAAIFLSTAFEGGRHCGRVGKIMVIEKR